MRMEIDIFTLAHEIKNPLAIANGYLQMSNNENFMKYKEFIKNNIEEALMVLDNYLEYNKLSIEFEVMDLILLLEEVINNYASLYEIDIDLITVYDELYISGDFIKLKQVFNNIIKNSIEAKSKNIKIYLKMRNGEVLIRVVDDGDGINNFDNLDGYSSKVNGHGIGVVIAKKVIACHEGTINYENNDEGGCSVFINLPIKL